MLDSGAEARACAGKTPRMVCTGGPSFHLRLAPVVCLKSSLRVQCSALVTRLHTLRRLLRADCAFRPYSGRGIMSPQEQHNVAMMQERAAAEAEVERRTKLTYLRL